MGYQSSSPTQAPDLSAYNIQSSWRNPEPAALTLLVVYAHPDDESFGNAGTIARYSAEGVAVHYACATRGESGTVAAEHMGDYADIATLRTSELECAADVLKLAAVHYLGYRDSGMQGSADNQHPDSLVQAPVERVTGQIVALIRTFRPQVVLTFNPYGGYGHPDHIAIHTATLAAFRDAGDAQCYPEHLHAGMQVWTPSKLYYSTFGTRFLRLMITGMRIRRQDPQRLGTNSDIDLVRAATEATPITTSVDGRDYLAEKESAWQCHRSQLGPQGAMMRLPLIIRRQLSGSEYFTRVVPPWPGKRPQERDLFEGVDR